MQGQTRSHGRFDTENASKYLQQMCKHFAHKVPVTFDASSGTVALPQGACRLEADAATLRIEVTADDLASLETARRIIDSHLARFAFREDFSTMAWS